MPRIGISVLSCAGRHPNCVVASDVRMNRDLTGAGQFVYCDVQDKDNLARIILENGVNTVVHLATLLSGPHPSVQRPAAFPIY